VERWEFTEVDNPRRRRGQEMRRVEALRAAGKSTSKSVPIDRLTKQAERVPGWIRKRCKEKVAKHYSGRADLLIYLNWSEFGVRHAEIERTFSVATASAKEAFTEVWILWKDRLYRTWRLRVAAETVKDAPGTHYP
jgi:ribosomal protein L39E